MDNATLINLINRTLSKFRKELNVDLSDYVTKENGKGLSTNDFSNNYKSVLDDIINNSYDFSSFITSGALEETLKKYVSNTSLTTILKDYITSSAVDTKLSDYVTNTSLTNTLNDYIKSSALDNYVKNNDLTTTLASYVTIKSLQNTLSDYTTTADLNKLLSDFVKSAAFHNYIVNDEKLFSYLNNPNEKELQQINLNMTSNNSPSPYIVYGTDTVYKAFDGDETTYAEINNTEGIKLDLGYPINLSKIKFDYSVGSVKYDDSVSGDVSKYNDSTVPLIFVTRVYATNDYNTFIKVPNNYWHNPEDDGYTNLVLIADESTKQYEDGFFSLDVTSTNKYKYYIFSIHINVCYKDNSISRISEIKLFADTQSGLDFITRTEVKNILEDLKKQLTLGKIDFDGYVKTIDLTKELDKKVDKEDGKGLSSNDFTAPYKNILDKFTLSDDEKKIFFNGEPIGTLRLLPVDSLPTENIDLYTIYMVKGTNPTDSNNIFTEYMYVNSKWEKMGQYDTNKIDLSNYATKSDLDTVSKDTSNNVSSLNSKITNANNNIATNSNNITKLNADLSNFKDDVNNLIKIENDYNEW